MHVLLNSSLASLLGLLIATSAVAKTIDFTVEAASEPVADATVTIWRVSAGGAPQKAASGTTDSDGKFYADISGQDSYFFATAQSGKLSLLTALGNTLSVSYRVNELTTIASVFTHAQFISGSTISGPTVALAIASGNVPNFVNLSTGGWGEVLLDPNNSTESETLSRINTLGNLVSLCAIPGKEEHCDQFLKYAGETANTLEAITAIAKAPWRKAEALFKVFTQAFTVPESTNPQARRAGVTYLPYLMYAPDDFSLSLRFSGGGVFSAGRLQFDATGNMWSGQNWMPGTQAGSVNGIGGGLAKLSSNGAAISPPITGYTGMSVDGVGWGTAVDNEKVWVSSFNSVIGVFDLDGIPLGPQEGITLGNTIGEGQGIAIAPNGDVWVADATKDQLVLFPHGDPADGRIVNVDQLAAPFGVIVDNDNIVWVTNSQGSWVTKFPAEQPEKAERIILGAGLRGVDIDSRGNVWVASNMSASFPPPRFPSGPSTIMKEFEIAYTNFLINSNLVPTGHISLITAEGNTFSFKGAQNQINAPWGISLDGNDNVWVGNFLGESLLYFCGATGQCPEGYSRGDLIHNYQSGTVQKVTDAAIDSAGNVWVANNWNIGSAVVERDPVRRDSTKGGGSGITVFYGIASPVATPKIGPARPLER
ncbi:Virginiamycin B lyase [Pseudovibrio axinellae]|uniref:Virginiamycin B lyase n=1 Tax=Pseudovibrio axinellae TaxID=989403 RepID=A0A165SYT5_9HYPH|nr:hypothetical protein [Pseudovibrio axinellae]KZL05036.1 Virginiamycin B lyase [Pseudovibrio axinellae]SER65548.1 hypothetical protein SAMN05421798_11540 [Pseudovibrio axinellae]